MVRRRMACDTALPTVGSAPGRGLAYYRLYRFSGPNGRITGFEEIEAEGDAAALAAAQAYRGERPLELWCGSRKVTAIPAVGEDGE